MKSNSFSLNIRDLKKTIPALLSSMVGYYLSNTEQVNSLFVQMGADPKFLVAIFPVITYLSALYFKGNGK